MADERMGGMDVEGVLRSGPMEQMPPRHELPKDVQMGIGLGVASLTLGLMSVGLSVLVIGAGAGFVGLILAIVHLGKGLPLRAMAVWGLVLSLIGGAASIGFGLVYGVGVYQTYKEMGETAEGGPFSEFYGEAAPDVNFTDLDGNEIRLADLKGKRVMLDFWATWCPPCKMEIPHIVELRKTVSTDELVIIGISDEPAEKMKPFATRQKMNYPLVSMDSAEMPQPFNEIESLPTVFFIDANGVIESALTGYQPLEKLRKHALGLEEEGEKEL